VLWFSALGFAATVFSVIGVIILTGAADGMVGMYLKFFTGLPRALTLVQSAQILAPNLLLQIIVFICIAVALGLRVPSMATLTAKLRTDAASRFIFGLWFAGSGYALIGIYTGAAYAADSNHYAPAMYFVLLATVAVGVNSRIPLSHPIRRSAILVAACWVAASPVFFFLPRFPGWYLYQNNFLEHAYQYSKSHPGEAYFPWQPLSVLLAEGRLYHLGEQLFYEDHLGMPLRKPAQYLAHLPAEAEFIAVRPFGAPASVLPMLFPDVQSGGEVDGLPGWQVYRFTDDRLHVTLPK
jgi:hypothetical protein